LCDKRVSICVCSHISKPACQNFTKFPVHVTAARYSDDSAMRYVLSVLWMTAHLAIIGQEKVAPVVLVLSRGVAMGGGGISVYIPSQNQSLKLFCALIAANDVRLLVYRTVVLCSKNLYLPKRISGYAPGTQCVTRGMTGDAV